MVEEVEGEARSLRLHRLRGGLDGACSSGFALDHRTGTEPSTLRLRPRSLQPRAMSALSRFVSHLFINTRTDTIVGYES